MVTHERAADTASVGINDDLRKPGGSLLGGGVAPIRESRADGSGAEQSEPAPVPEVRVGC